MTATTDCAAFCVACGKYKAYRDGLCWGYRAEVERLQREFDHMPDTDEPKKEES